MLGVPIKSDTVFPTTIQIIPTRMKQPPFSNSDVDGWLKIVERDTDANCWQLSSQSFQDCY